MRLGWKRLSGSLSGSRALVTGAASQAGKANGTPQIYIIHDEEPYVRPLLREMARRGIQFKEWNLNAAAASSNLVSSTPSNHVFDMSSEPPTGVFYNRISACGCPEHRDVPQLARGMLMWLLRHRRRIVNGPESIALTASKMEMQIALHLSNIETPRSIACFDNNQIVRAAESFQGCRFMLEPNRRDLGKGVVPFHTIDELKEHLYSGNFIQSADNITVVQEYIKSKAPYVNRVEFVGGRCLYGMHVDITRGWDRLIPGHQVDPKHPKVNSTQTEEDLANAVPLYQVIPDFDHPILDKYVEFMDKHGIDVASFEFAEDAEGNAITFDVDICSTYNAAAEYRANVPQAGVGAIADYLSRLLELERPIKGTQHARMEKTAPAMEPEVKAVEKQSCLVVDGGMGRELKARAPDMVKQDIWSASALFENPELIKEVHKDFVKSGAKVITANNYACTPQFLAKGGLEDQLEPLLETALRLACEARDECGVPGVQVAASLPPLNESYRSDLVGSLNELLPVYEHLVSIMQRHPIDIIVCETMSSKEEAYAAAKAATQSGRIVWVAWTLRDDLSGRLRSGDTVEEAFDFIKDFDVSAYLFNCCVPEAIEQSLPTLLRLTDKPVGAMPNCFAPIPTDWTLSGPHGFNTMREDMRPMDYVGYMRGWVDKGASIVGGCCGIGPGHIQVLTADVDNTTGV